MYEMMILCTWIRKAEEKISNISGKALDGFPLILENTLYAY
jgi:hypothetical protein